MIRTLRRASLPAIVCCTVLAAFGAHADTMRKYGAWTVTCAAEAYCTASSRLTGRQAAPYTYQLRVTRFASGEREIAFLPAAAAPAPGGPIVVAVDSGTRFTLQADSGYRQVGGNTFVLAQAVTAELLAAMRRGRQAAFTYKTAAGARQQPSFALRGLSQALTAAGIDAQPQPARAAAAPAAASKSRGEATAPAQVPTAAAEQSESAKRSTAQGAAAPAESQPAGEAPRVTTEPAAATSGPPPVVLPGPALEPAAGVKPTQAAAPAAGRKRVKAVQQFACRGNEPFWSLIVDHDTARYAPLRAGAVQEIALAGKLRVTGEGRTPEVDWRGKAADGGAYRVLIRERPCADTMSDTSGADAGAAQGGAALPYRASLTLPDGKVVEGCCSAGLTFARAAPEQAQLDDAPIADLAAKPPGDWSRFLLELLPGIDACLARTPGGAPYTTKAWPMNQGLVGVRTRNAVAGWFECVAQYDGRSVQRFEAVTAEAGPLPGEGYVLYTPASGQPLAGNCWQHERVVDFSGTALGWLSTNGC
jgi:uncharacterized membrane protein/invasion protein IalB